MRKPNASNRSKQLGANTSHGSPEMLRAESVTILDSGNSRERGFRRTEAVIFGAGDVAVLQIKDEGFLITQRFVMILESAIRTSLDAANLAAPHL
jgi:hypothetical protein